MKIIDVRGLSEVSQKLEDKYQCDYFETLETLVTGAEKGDIGGALRALLGVQKSIKTECKGEISPIELEVRNRGLDQKLIEHCVKKLGQPTASYSEAIADTWAIFIDPKPVDYSLPKELLRRALTPHLWAFCEVQELDFWGHYFILNDLKKRVQNKNWFFCIKKLGKKEATDQLQGVIGKFGLFSDEHKKASAMLANHE